MTSINDRNAELKIKVIQKKPTMDLLDELEIESLKTEVQILKKAIYQNANGENRKRKIQ